MNWKTKIKEAVEKHRGPDAGGVTLLSPHDPPVEDIVLARAPAVENLVIQGRLIGKTPIGRWLWENRNCKALRAIDRRHVVLWTHYDEDADQSYVGLAVLVEKSVADRWVSLVPELDVARVS